MKTNRPNTKLNLPSSIARWRVLGWTALLLACAPLAGRAAVCSYSISAPSGLSMIANQCDAVGGNTLNNVLPAVPNGSKIIKWNKQTQSYDPPAIFNAGSWSPNGVPGNTDKATINSGSTVVSTAVTVRQLDLNGGTSRFLVANCAPRNDTA